MLIKDIVNEASVPSIRQQIINDVQRHGSGEYFVRFTTVDRLGFSARQTFARSPDVDDPGFDIDYIGTGRGRRALWFYPLNFYLKSKDAYASKGPYVWLVKLKPDAWLQPVRSGDRQVQAAPYGQQRVGLLRKSMTPAAIFFQPGFDVVGRYYDYAGQHQRHGQVKGQPNKTWFDRIRGN